MESSDHKKLLRAFIKQLNDLLECLPSDMTVLRPEKGSYGKTPGQLTIAIEKLIELREILNPAKAPTYTFDPANPHVIGSLIAETLIMQQKVPIGGVSRFYGSGVYAIYYNGPHEAYSMISGTEVPIYVGKADPDIPIARTPGEQGESLYKRLIGDHKKNIEKATNLNIDDFMCRYLVVTTAWQATAEYYLIDWFKPVWNKECGVCKGFGKHGDSPTTRANTRSPWDTLHPGREWATSEGNKPNPQSVEEVQKIIQQFLAEQIPHIRIPRKIQAGVHEDSK